MLGHKWEIIEAELQKCQLLCHKCHSQKSHIERGEEQVAVHGSLAMYNTYKCRCQLCRNAKSLDYYKRREYYQAKTRAL